MAKMMGDPYDDFLRRDEEQAEWLANRPVCEICGGTDTG